MKEIFLSSLYLVVLYCLSRFIFEPTYLYFEIWWLDIPMHLLGGAGIASLTIAILSYKNKKINYKKIVLSIIVVALLWEFYEYISDLIYLGYWNGNWKDTISDIFNGLVGASISYLIYKK